MATNPSPFTDRKQEPNSEVTLGRHTTMQKPPAGRTQKANPDVTLGRHTTNDDQNKSTMTIEPDPTRKPKSPDYALPVDATEKHPLTTT